MRRKPPAGEVPPFAPRSGYAINTVETIDVDIGVERLKSSALLPRAIAGTTGLVDAWADASLRDTA